MESTFWERVLASGHKVPSDRPLADLTSELTSMLGDSDPHRRVGIAYPTLSAWVSEGVYDDLLQGLGDGMTAGLVVGLGEDRTDTVFRRSYSALVLAQCILRDNDMHLVPSDKILRWGDRVAGWYIRERDLRGLVTGGGWARTLAHGADTVAALAGSEWMGRLELTVLLDVIADRLLVPTSYHLVSGEVDRMALATMSILRRELVGLDVLEPWVTRLGAQATAARLRDDHADVVPGNVQSYLRALHLQLALARKPPSCRSDLLLVLIEQLQRTNPDVLDA